MSFPVTRPAPSTTTTSLVHEHICLFTHDLKRKTKRWQDGRLKFHLFNKRIVVTDDRGGNVGDAHWTLAMSSSGSDVMEEGDEFGLDRGGAIVQVCERVGCREVDLTGLVDKRVREVERRRKEAAVRPSPGNPPTSSTPARALATPARIGKAVIPKESPFEQRMRREGQQQQQQQDTPPPAKRQKREPSPKSSHARALFGTALTLTAPSSSWARPSQVLGDRTNIGPQLGSSQGRENGDKRYEESSHCERRKENRRDREPSPEEESESLFVQEEAPRRPTVATGSSRLGGLRIERERSGDRRPMAQAESTISKPKPLKEISSPQAPAPSSGDVTLGDYSSSANRPVPPASKKSKLAANSSKPRPQPKPQARAPSPEDHTMDDDEDVPVRESTPPLPKKSKAATKSCKPLLQTVPSKGRTTAREMAPQATMKSNQRSPSPRPASPSRSKQHEDASESKPARLSARSNDKIEKKTRLRIKTRKRGGLLMLAQPEPEPKISEEEDKTPDPVPAKKSSPKNGNAAFEAWLDDDDDLSKGLGELDREASLLQGAEQRPAEKGDAQKSNDREGDDDEALPTAATTMLEASSRSSKKAKKQKIVDESQDAGEKPTTNLAAEPPTPAELQQAPGQHSPGPKQAKRSTDQVAQQSPKASCPPTAKDNVPADSPYDRQSPPRHRLRSKKQTTKPAITLPVTSPTSTPTEPDLLQPSYLNSSESEDDWAGPAPAAASRRRTKQASDATNHKNDAKKDSAKAKKATKKKDSGVTVSRISRSCKSKVITGFVEKSEGLVPGAFAGATERMGWGSAAKGDAGLGSIPSLSETVPNAETALETSMRGQPKTTQAKPTLKEPSPEKPTQEKTTSTENTADSSAGPEEDKRLQESLKLTEEDPQPMHLDRLPADEEANNPKAPTRQISNPATRGRKAASKAHAAGQLLPVNVPFDQPPSALVRAALPSAKPAPVAEKGKGMEKKEEIREKGLPGFAKANGGAWSRHADDLLGAKRPVRRGR